MVVDTDIILRFLTNDDPTKAQRFETYLNSGTKVKLTDVTVAEIYWTLKSFYQLDKSLIILHLQALINHPSVICHRALLRETLNIFKSTSLSYVDSYTTAYASLKDNSQILSYDRGFDKLLSLTRLEP